MSYEKPPTTPEVNEKEREIFRRIAQFNENKRDIESILEELSIEIARKKKETRERILRKEYARPIHPLLRSSIISGLEYSDVFLFTGTPLERIPSILEQGLRTDAPKHATLQHRGRLFMTRDLNDAIAYPGMTLNDTHSQYIAILVFQTENILKSFEDNVTTDVMAFHPDSSLEVNQDVSLDLVMSIFISDKKAPCIKLPLTCNWKK